MSGDDGARKQFLDLYEADRDRVVAFLMENGASLPEAQDAVQESFLDGWRMVCDGRWETITYPAAWIRTVALRRYRRPHGPRRRPPTAPGLPERSIPDPTELTVQTMSVLQALSNLDEDSRAVIAFQMDGFSAVQTAAALGMDDQRVRNLRKKARAQLARILADGCGK